MTLKTIILFLILFLALRFLLKFLLPIIAVTRQTQRSINDLKSQMESMAGQGNAAKDYSHKPTSNNTSKKIDGEYIDYEEVK